VQLYDACTVCTAFNYCKLLFTIMSYCVILCAAVFCSALLHILVCDRARSRTSMYYCVMLSDYMYACVLLCATVYYYALLRTTVYYDALLCIFPMNPSSRLTILNDCGLQALVWSQGRNALPQSSGVCRADRHTAYR